MKEIDKNLLLCGIYVLWKSEKRTKNSKQNIFSLDDAKHKEKQSMNVNTSVKGV